MSPPTRSRRLRVGAFSSVVGAVTFMPSTHPPVVFTGFFRQPLQCVRPSASDVFRPAQDHVTQRLSATALRMFTHWTLQQALYCGKSRRIVTRLLASQVLQPSITDACM